MKQRRGDTKKCKRTCTQNREPMRECPVGFCPCKRTKQQTGTSSRCATRTCQLSYIVTTRHDSFAEIFCKTKTDIALLFSLIERALRTAKTLVVAAERPFLIKIAVKPARGRRMVSSPESGKATPPPPPRAAANAAIEFWNHKCECPRKEVVILHHADSGDSGDRKELSRSRGKPGLCFNRGSRTASGATLSGRLDGAPASRRGWHSRSGCFIHALLLGILRLQCPARRLDPFRFFTVAHVFLQPG